MSENGRFIFVLIWLKDLVGVYRVFQVVKDVRMINGFFDWFLAGDFSSLVLRK